MTLKRTPLKRKTPLKRTSGPARRGAEVTCETCGAKFYAPQYEIARGRKYCSQKCMGKGYEHPQHRAGGYSVPRTCTICGETFYVDWRRRRRKTCSDECWRQAGVRAKKGPRNPGWKGGGPNLPAWRDARESRCRVCGKRGRLFLHHVVYEQHVKARGGNAFDPRDSLTLCFGCHMAHHHGADGRIPVSKLRAENIEFAVELLGAAARDYFVRYYDVDLLIDVFMGDAMEQEREALKHERDELRDLARRAMALVDSEWAGTSHVANPETGVGRLYMDAERLDALPDA